MSTARLAYAIQMSPANYHLLPRLMRALYDQDNYYALHFDPKIAPADVKQQLLDMWNTLRASGISYRHENVVVLKPEIVTYRGITMTLNFLTCAEKLLSVGDWDFFINLSGADFPTASQKTMKKLLYRTRNANFVEWKARRTWGSYAKRRLGHFYVDTGLVTRSSENGSYLTGYGSDDVDAADEGAHVRNPIADHVDFTLAKSSGWLILSKRFTRFLLRNSQSKKLLMALAYSDASDEHYFGSMLWNSGFRDTVVNSNMRNIFFVAPNGSFALGADGRRRRQHPFWVDELDEDGKELMFWRQLWNEPAFFTRKIRALNGFCARVEREMIGLGDKVDKVRVGEYEAALTKSFSALVEPLLARTVADAEEDEW
ncbi:Glycosyltransferase 14 [Gracilaria domingensis]|nr:Glycosyltransferase 14 [Gracilaria domingensis]